MVRDLAKVSRIDKIEPIKGKDRIELAMVNNYTVIVGKDEYKVGDLCVYIFYDTILPIRKEFDFLKSRCYSPAYDGYRIKNMKMAGVYSSGIVFPLSIVNKKYHKLNKDVSDVLNIVRYDPEKMREKQEEKDANEKHLFRDFMLRYKWLNKIYTYFHPKTYKMYPTTVSKSSETNIEKCFNEMKGQYPTMEFYLTEKMEGSAGTWLLLGKKNNYIQLSHNVYKNPNETSNWTTVANDLQLEKLLRAYKKETGNNIAIQGEICGPGIQSNVYGFEKPTLFVYKITNTSTGEAMNFDELQQTCRKLKLSSVPYLKKQCLYDTVEEMLEHCEGDSVFKNKGNKVKREGIVWRSVTDQSIGFKCKSRSYQAWFGKKFDKTL